jgi:hypothetical protein
MKESEWAAYWRKRAVSAEYLLMRIAADEKWTEIVNEHFQTVAAGKLPDVADSAANTPSEKP